MTLTSRAKAPNIAVRVTFRTSRAAKTQKSLSFQSFPMKKLTYADLTPEFLMELKALGTAEEIADACRRKDFEISAEGAARLLEQFRKAEQLSREKLDVVAGGGKGYSGTGT